MVNSSLNSRKYNFWFLLFFLVSPLFSYIAAIRNYRAPFSKNVVWFFAAFLGYCLQIQLDSTSDSAVYMNNFLNYYNYRLGYDHLTSSFFSNRNHIEIVGNLISMTVAQFTNNYHFLFMSYGLFFGYFFSRNIAYIYENFSGNLRKGSIWITVAITFVIPLWNINGFDFWTASQVFIYGLLPIICERKYNRVLFIALCPLIHFSFYFMFAITFLFVFAKRFKKALVLVFIVSFFFTGIDSSKFSFLFSYFPDILVERTEAYLNASKANTGGNIIRVVSLIYSFSVYFVFFRSYKSNITFIESNRHIERLYLFSFYIVGVFNVLSVIPSVGRFLYIGQIFLLMAIFLLLNAVKFENHRPIYNDIKKIRGILILFWSISILRFLLPMLGVGSILSNPFLVHLFVEDDFVFGNFLDFLNN